MMELDLGRTDLPSSGSLCNASHCGESAIEVDFGAEGPDCGFKTTVYVEMALRSEK